MSPWRSNMLDLLREIIRFSLWFAIVLIGLMFLVFSVSVVFQFLSHLHGFLRRTIFSGPW